MHLVNLMILIFLKHKKYYQNKSKFNGVYSRNTSPKIKDGAYIRNLDEYKLIRNPWIDLHVNGYNVTSFNSCAVEHIPKKIKKFRGNRNVTTNSFRIQAYDSIMSEYFCTEFTDFMLKDKSLLNYSNLFSPNKYEKYDKIILK